MGWSQMAAGELFATARDSRRKIVFRNGCLLPKIIGIPRGYQKRARKKSPNAFVARKNSPLGGEVLTTDGTDGTDVQNLIRGLSFTVSKLGKEAATSERRHLVGEFLLKAASLSDAVKKKRASFRAERSPALCLESAGRSAVEEPRE